jgi:hypothetical protein
LTHQCSPPEPVIATPVLRVAARESAVGLAQGPAPFGQSKSRPTCSSIEASSALKSGLFTACAITLRRHSAVCRAVAASRSLPP